MGYVCVLEDTFLSQSVYSSAFAFIHFWLAQGLQVSHRWEARFSGLFLILHHSWVWVLPSKFQEIYVTFSKPLFPKTSYSPAFPTRVVRGLPQLLSFAPGGSNSYICLGIFSTDAPWVDSALGEFQVKWNKDKSLEPLIQGDTGQNNYSSLRMRFVLLPW